MWKSKWRTHSIISYVPRRINAVIHAKEKPQLSIETTETNFRCLAFLLIFSYNDPIQYIFFQDTEFGLPYL